MKQFIVTAIALLSCASMLVAGGLDKVVAKVAASSMTSSVSSVATTSRVTGYLNRIDFTFANATSPIDSVVLISSNTLTGIATTHIELTYISTNASYMLTNHVQRASVYDEAFYLTVTNTHLTNQTVQAAVFYERP